MDHLSVSKLLLAHLYVLLLLPVMTKPSLENSLAVSMLKATTCKSRNPPKEPVLALTPKRYVQVVAMLRHRAKVPACGIFPSNSVFNLNKSETWPFCSMGNCIDQRCECTSSFTGKKCEEYKGKCWLMYCFLGSCKSIAQMFRCKCDPSYYGKEVLSNEYWYDEGKKRHFVAPPEGWIDDIPDEGSSGRNSWPPSVIENKVGRELQKSNDQSSAADVSQDETNVDETQKKLSQDDKDNKEEEIEYNYNEDYYNNFRERGEARPIVLIGCFLAVELVLHL